MNDHLEVAIVGMSCLFPGSGNDLEYWHSLANGKNSIREISHDRWNHEEYYSPLITTENKMVSKWAGLLDDIRGFDFQFFGLLPEEARNMDPQSRLMLQEVWHCLEDAAITLTVLQQAKTAVYVGAFSLDYLQWMARAPTVEAYACHGNYPCMIANRISHFLNLKGASFSIDAACASSLVALHEAKLALRQGLCDYAIVGAVNLISHPWHHIAFSKCRMLSPDGQCKTFDRDANGYVRGEGVATILMTTKERALKENCRIHSLVKGSAINHCGNTRTISTPNFHAQKAVIEEALKDANILPEQIDYLETHGTGTALGDAIECHALREIFANKETLYIGSVKTNIGHLEAAAGLAGVTKVILMLRHSTIPKHLNLSCPNPIIDFENSPLKVPFENLPWERQGRARLGGISSFGFGGVNSHVILEEFIDEKTLNSQSIINFHSALKKESFPNQHIAFPMLFSAKSKDSLEKQIDKMKATCSNTTQNIKNISYTLLKGRHNFSMRAAFLSRNHVDLSIPISHISLPKGPRAFCFGDLTQEVIKFLNPLRASLLSIEEEAKLSEKFSPNALGAYLIGKLLLRFNIPPLLFFGEGEGQSVAHELFLAMNEQVYFFDLSSKTMINSHMISLKECTQIAEELSVIDQVDQPLLNQIKNLCDQQYAFKKTLSSLDRLLQPYNLSILPLTEIPLRSTYSPLLNFTLLIALNEFYKKYQLSHRYRSPYAVLHLIDDLVCQNRISIQEALHVTYHPAEISQILCKLPSLEELLKNHLVINIGTIKNSFTDHTIEYQANKDPWEDLLQIIMTLWMDGEDIRWDRFANYFYQDGSVVSLPGYCFESTPFWCLS
jgi:3-oxoacyl-(acyl-carrier-protein) synthase